MGLVREREAVAEPVLQGLDTWWQSLGLEVSVLRKAIVWLCEGWWRIVPCNIWLVITAGCHM